MQAAIERSYLLLRELERRLLSRLSVFRGGWTLEAAEAVGTGEEIDEDEMLDLLAGLVEQSLVVAETREDGATRYRRFMPVREYAEERLEQSGEADDTRRRHADFFLALAEQAAPELEGPEQVAWLDRLEQEHDNLRVAMSSLLVVNDADSAVRLSWALWVFWWIRNYQSEARRWGEQILDQATVLSFQARARTLCERVLSALSRQRWMSRNQGMLDYEGFRSGSHQLAHQSLPSGTMFPSLLG